MDVPGTQQEMDRTEMKGHRKMKKMKRKHRNGRAACLTLALVLTLTVLPADGEVQVLDAAETENAQAADTQKEQAADTQKEQTTDTQKEQSTDAQKEQAEDTQKEQAEDVQKEQAAVTVNLQELLAENETLPRAITEEDVVFLPKAEQGEKVNFHTLRLQVTRYDDTTHCLNWKAAKDADGYEVYGARCNTKKKSYKAVQITAMGPDITMWVCKDLKPNTYYKYIVRAYKMVDGKKVYIARSEYAHLATGGGTYGVIGALLVHPQEVSLKKNEAFQIKTFKTSGMDKTREHAALRFESTKASVAAVDEKGVITAKKAGSCTIYVFTQNGLYEKVKVTVQ